MVGCERDACRCQRVSCGLISANRLLLLLSLGRPNGYAPAKQGSKDCQIEQGFALVALHQPVEMDASGSSSHVDEAMEANPVLSEGTDGLLGGGECKREQDDPGKGAHEDKGALGYIVGHGRDAKALIEPEIGQQVQGSVEKRKKTD